MPRRSVFLALLLASVFPFSAAAQSQSPLIEEPQWSLVNPSNTGIPGELIHLVRWAPSGDLWVAARWPFWQQGGIGAFDLETEIWSGWSNFETPIPSEYINDIDFDASGVAWISTDAGLVRFDGKKWRVYDPTNTPMQLWEVGNVSIAPNGVLWINNSSFSASGDAIWEFDGAHSWTSYTVGNELPWYEPWTDLSAVFVASNGHVWVANDTLGGVAEYDGATWTLRGESLGRLSGMVEDQFNNIWIKGHSVGGAHAFFRWNGESFSTFPMASPTTLAFDADDGMVYFGNWHGEVRRTPNGGQTTETFLTGLSKVFSIAPHPSESDVWIGTIGAVGHFTGNGSLVRDYNSYNTGTPWYWIDRNSMDRDGYLWAASGEGGLSRFDGARWRNWGNHNAGAEPYPFAGNELMGTAFQDSSGVHWFGGNGIARWNSANGTFDGFWNWQNNPGMGVGLWTFFAEDAARNVFAIEEYGTTFRFNPASQLWDKEPIQPYAVSGVPGMVSDSAGNVWITAWFDLHKWDGRDWSKVELPYPDYFFDLGGINRMAIGPDDVMWFGTVNGLVRWDGQSFSLYDTSNSPLPHGLVPGVAVRDDGLVGLSAVHYGPFEGEAAVILIDGDPSQAQNWAVYHYGASPLPTYDLDSVAFGARGDFWVNSKLGGSAVVHVGKTETLQLKGAEPGIAGMDNIWIVTGATPGASIRLVRGQRRSAEGLPLPGCASGELSIEKVKVIGSAVVDEYGVARIPWEVPASAQGRLLFFQAVELSRCAVSPVVAELFE